MGLKAGYRQTEVGMIPEEWEVSTLGRITECLDNLRVPLNETQRLRRKGDYPYCGANGALDYIDGFVIDDEIILVAEDGGYFDEFETRPIAYRMSGKCWVNNHAHILKAKGEISQDYLFYSLVHKNILRYLASGTRAKLNRSEMDRIEIGLPGTLPEQRAIAGALGDVDALLDALTRLITKKRDLKQAAMQQLLTGQTRLPGFSSEWEVERLGEVAEIVSGGTPRTGIASYWDGGIRWCTPTDITGTTGKYLSETARTISQAGLDSCSAQLLPAGALLLCSRATIGELKIAACDVCTNQGFKSLIAKEGVSNEYLYYLLLTMKPQLVERAIGSTFLEISKKDTASLEVPLPLFDEQTAIAAVLSDIDVGIAALEHRLTKTRALKQGMMQELLTGKTRLV